MWKRWFILLSILVSACSAQPTEQPETNTLYFVEEQKYDLSEFGVENGWQMSVDENCETGIFPLPVVASLRVVIELMNGTITVIANYDGVKAQIEVNPPSLVSETDWKTLWHSGELDINKEMNFALRNWEGKRYVNVTNCFGELRSRQVYYP